MFYCSSNCFVLKYLNQFNFFLFIYLQILDYVSEDGRVKEKKDKTDLNVFNLLE